MPDTILYTDGLAPIAASNIQVTPPNGTSGPLSSFINNGTAIPLDTIANGLTASTTQTLAGALPLTAAFNVVSTVGTAGDSVKLPAVNNLNVGLAQQVWIINNGASALSIFPTESATAIDTHATAAAGTLTTLHRGLFIQNSASTWVSIASVSAAS